MRMSTMTASQAPATEAPSSIVPVSAGRPLLVGRTGELVLVGLLVVIAAAVRWVDLWSIPIFTDEGDEIGLALRIARDGAHPLTNDDPYLGPLFNYLLGGLFWLAGPSPWLPRLLMLGLGTLTVVLVYLLARELTLAVQGATLHPTGTARQPPALTGTAVIGGAIAALLLAVNPTHVLVISHVAWGACFTACLTTAAAWLFVSAARRAEIGKPGNWRAGLWLVPAAAALGLAFQTHPMVAAFLPAVGLYVLWRMRAWLLTPWPYLAALAFVLAQLPTLLFIAANGLARWLAAIREKQTMYEGDSALSGPVWAGRLDRLFHSLGAVLGGSINDRDTPLAPFWHPAVLVALLVTPAVVVWLWRKRQPLIPMMVLGNVLLLPLVTGTFAPLISSGRYLVPVVTVLLAGLGSWTACSAPLAARLARLNVVGLDADGAEVDGATAGGLARPDGAGRALLAWAPLAGALVIGIASAVTLVSFSLTAHQQQRTNDRLLASLGALTVAVQPGDVVSIDRAMYRDWTLTEGRLQRVFESWLETSGVSSRVVDVEDGGRLRRDLADRGGIVVLARRTVPLVAGAYDLQEIASDTAPGAPSGTGYSIVRVRPRP
jgi:4-amino-4-deoxy-L-arabinose transferase-like glycosyltransferase